MIQIKKRKAPRTAFKKGQSGNPGGRRKVPADIREARSMSYDDMCRTVIEVRLLTPADLKNMDMERIPLGKRAIINAYAKMDYRGIKDFEDRLWGKAKESIDLNGQGGIHIHIDKDDGNL